MANYWALDIFRRCSSDFDDALRTNLGTCVFSFYSRGDLLTFKISCKTRLANLGHETQDIGYVEYSISSLLRAQCVYRLTPRGEFDYKALIKRTSLFF